MSTVAYPWEMRLGLPVLVNEVHPSVLTLENASIKSFCVLFDAGLSEHPVAVSGFIITPKCLLFFSLSMSFLKMSLFSFRLPKHESNWLLAYTNL